MARQTIKEQLYAIEQEGAQPPEGYTYDPRHEPRLYKTDDDGTEDVASRLHREASEASAGTGEGNGD